MIKLFKDLRMCKKSRKEYHVKPYFKFLIDSDHYYFAFLPTILWMPWCYRYPNLHGVIDIWWLNFHILIGRWEVQKK